VDEFAPQTVAQITVKLNGRVEQATRRSTQKEVDALPGSPYSLDVGYSDYQAKVAAIHTRVIDEAMKMTEEHKDFGSAWTASGCAAVHEDPHRGRRQR